MTVSYPQEGYSDFCILQKVRLCFGFKILNFAIFLSVEVLSTSFMGMPIRAGILWVFHFPQVFCLG